MITGQIRNKVDRIWTDIWAGGIYGGAYPKIC